MNIFIRIRTYKYVYMYIFTLYVAVNPAYIIPSARLCGKRFFIVLHGLSRVLQSIHNSSEKLKKRRDFHRPAFLFFWCNNYRMYPQRPRLSFQKAQRSLSQSLSCMAIFFFRLFSGQKRSPAGISSV